MSAQKNQAKKTCLIISVEELIPTIHGGRIRTLRLATQLQDVVDVTVLAPTTKEPAEYEFQNIKFKLIPCGRKSLFSGRLSKKPRLGTVHFDPILELVLLEISSSRPSFVLWSHSYLAAIGMNKIRKLFPNVTQIVDFANVEALRFKSMSETKTGWSKAFLTLEYQKALLWERKVARNADLNLAITQADRNYIQVRYGSNAMLIPNGIDDKKFIAPSEGAIRLLTVANWDYYPNAEGLLHFLTLDWPKVLREYPDAHLEICGKANAEVVTKILKSSNASYHGFVEDLSDSYTRATAFLAPTRTGAGSQLKVSEALAHGRVVIGPAYLEREVDSVAKSEVILPTSDYLATLNVVRHSLELRSLAAHNLAKVYSWKQSLSALVEWVRCRD